jgi:hypothetical protein
MGFSLGVRGRSSSVQGRSTRRSGETSMISTTRPHGPRGPRGFAKLQYAHAVAHMYAAPSAGGGDVVSRIRICFLWTRWTVWTAPEIIEVFGRRDGPPGPGNGEASRHKLPPIDRGGMARQKSSRQASKSAVRTGSTLCLTRRNEGGDPQSLDKVSELLPKRAV